MGALQGKLDLSNCNFKAYYHHYIKNLHETEGLLYENSELVYPFALKNAIM